MSWNGNTSESVGHSIMDCKIYFIFSNGEGKKIDFFSEANSMTCCIAEMKISDRCGNGVTLNG